MRRRKKDPVGYADFHTPVAADIVAQTIDKIAVDIVAQTLDKIKMDLVAQTIESVDVDIYAQTIAEVIMRFKLGMALWERWRVKIPAWAERKLVDVVGKGHIYYALLGVDPAINSHLCGYRIRADFGPLFHPYFFQH